MPLYSEQLDTVNMIMIVMGAFKIDSDLPTRELWSKIIYLFQNVFIS